MEDSVYDVIVVGGGPAGGSAAYFLTQGRKKVLVLEKAHLPRYKTCGGGLSARFLSEQFPFSFDPILKTEVCAISYAYHGRMVTLPLRPRAISMVMRDDLDNFLLAHCGADLLAGAVVSRIEESQNEVSVELQDGRRFTAGYVIGADGANSVVARSIGLRPERVLVAAIEAEVGVPPEVMQRFGQVPVFIFGEIKNGYLWIFPKQDHLSVGAAAYRPARGALQQVLTDGMKKYGISLEGAEVRGHPIPIYTHREAIATRRVLLAGDAAGLADPLSGEGIRFAIKSGRLAAEAILSGVVFDYNQRLHRSIGFNHLLTLGFALVFYRFQGLLLALGASNPFSTQELVDMLADHSSTAGFVLRTILTTPVFAVTELVAWGLKVIGRPQAAVKIRQSVYPPDIRAVP